MLKNLISPIVTIAALGMIESLLCGASASRMKNEPFNADQELIAQGRRQHSAAAFRRCAGYGSHCAHERSGEIRQQTRLCERVPPVFLLASMFLLGGVMARLPLRRLPAF